MSRLARLVLEELSVLHQDWRFWVGVVIGALAVAGAGEVLK